MSEVPQQVQVKDQKAEPKRFVEKGPMVIHDTKTDLYWLKKDSWQDKGKYLNWHEAKDFADNKNLRKVGGFADWRLPSVDEIQTLYDATAENVGKGDVKLRLDKIFPEGAYKMSWLTGDTSTRRPRFDFSEGKVVLGDEYSFGAVRICRKGIARNDDKSRRK